MKHIRIAIAALALVGLAAAPLLAQGHEEHHPQQRQEPAAQPPGGMMSGMNESMTGGCMTDHGTAAVRPSIMLERRTALGLSDAQVKSLESLEQAALEARREHMQRMEPIHERMETALQGDSPDMVAYERALRQMADEMVQMQLQAALNGQRALAVLTADQRSSVRGMDDRQGMGGGMMEGMSGGMDSCPKMQGGHGMMGATGAEDHRTS